ncbi:hypothetical protein BB561_003822 [Smittium simulii]|uniref:Bystin n=1 Tax=Smittium simulii TaxID=133385 RepID=A0A2T9YJG3_9FUNG|nr:hypothetical protein BB561_003822 [Smittium simulii]
MAKTDKKNKPKHGALYEDYNETDSKHIVSKSRPKYAERDLKRAKKERDQTFVDSKTTSKILQTAREQQEELEREEKELQTQQDKEYQKYAFRDSLNSKSKKRAFDINDGETTNDFNSGDEDADNNADDIFDQDFDQLEIELDPKDAAIFEKLMPKAPQQRQNLADIIAAKLQEFNEVNNTNNKDADNNVTDSNAQSDNKPMAGINQKVSQVYQKVGDLLSRYKSGPLPKAFKIIPSITNWEQVLYLTAPDNWTPHAICQATRIFISNMKPKHSQSLVVLDRVREDIEVNKKLNYHLYMALKKALYKPAAFFKGILFPLVESGNCTLREAVIISSVLAKVSVPVLHSAAALMHLATIDYSGPTALFIRVLLDKKYALPYRVIDALVFHFVGFANPANINNNYLNENGELPVLWHQSLLVFVQRYKSDLAPDQKSEIHNLIKVHYHPQISEEVSRELINSKCRDEIMEDPDMQNHSGGVDINMDML